MKYQWDFKKKAKVGAKEPFAHGVVEAEDMSSALSRVSMLLNQSGDVSGEADRMRLGKEGIEVMWELCGSVLIRPDRSEGKR